MEIITIENVMQYASHVMFIMFLLVFAVNVITEVLKRLIPNVPTDLVVFILSIVLTVVCLFVYTTMKMIVMKWYYIVGAIILGIFVAYAAMFGFDKFTELLNSLKKFKG